MSWSYSGDPNEEPKDAVRFLVGDTHSDDGFVSDEEIEWALSQNSNVYAAGAIVADALSTYFATQASSVSIGPIKEEYTQRAKDYTLRAKELSNKAAGKVALTFFAGGLSVADKEASTLNTSLVQPAFKIGKDDNRTSTNDTNERYSY